MVASQREMSAHVRKGGLWSIYFCVRKLVPMLYLKLWNYIDRPSVPSCPFCCVRPVVAVIVLCSSVRLVVRPVVVRPDIVSRRRRRPLSVRLSHRPSRRRRPSSVCPKH